MDVDSGRGRVVEIDLVGLDGTTVTCACHGSQLDVTSGAVIRGPAARPVRSRVVQVEGEDLLAET